MSRFVQTLKEAGLSDRVFNDRQLARHIGGSDARRYGLVNRSLKDGSLLRIKRGLYTLATEDARTSHHPFIIAQALQTGSYVSFESALSFHGWIPEAVHTTASVSSGRKALNRDTETFGNFSFLPIATEKFHFLAAIDRMQFGSSGALVARPLRALLDIVAQRKVSWTSMDWIEQGLRIDRSELMRLKRADFTALYGAYKHKKVRDFLSALENEVMQLKKTRSTSQAVTQ